MGFRLAAAAFAVISSISVFPAHNAALAQERLRFAVTDVEGLEGLQREYGPFKSAFEKASGMKLDLFPVSGRTAAVEAMAADQIDLVLTGPAEYVVFHARLKAQPVVSWGRPDYYSQVVVLENGPIRSSADLKGKKVSFGEIGSTSQHLGPAQLLRDAGLVHGSDYEPVYLKLNVAIEAMIRGDLSAIGMNRTHLERVVKAYPDRQFKILYKSAPLPNDLIIASPKLKAETVKKIRAAFVDNADSIMKAVISTSENAKFVGGAFGAELNDRDYDSIRMMFRAVNVNEFTKFVGN